MKRLFLIAAITYIASGCELNQDKPWVIVNKDRYTEYQKQIGLCRFKVSDGFNSEYFDDSCSTHNIGDTVHGKREFTMHIMESGVPDTLKH